MNLVKWRKDKEIPSDNVGASRNGRYGRDIMNGSLFNYISARRGIGPQCGKCVRPDATINIGEQYESKKHGKGKTKYYHVDCWERLLH